MKVDTLAEQILFSTLRIETDTSVGTGCIVNHEWANDKSGPFLVTNKHVVEGSSKGAVRFTLAQDEDPDLGQTFDVELSGNGWGWIGHPSDIVDVAALPLAPLIQSVKKLDKNLFYRTIPTSMIPNETIIQQIDAIEDVIFVGYPNGLYDQANNLPIARRGTTATPIYVDHNNEPKFLIDASVFPGSSGSPVFL